MNYSLALRLTGPNKTFTWPVKNQGDAALKLVPLVTNIGNTPFNEIVMTLTHHAPLDSGESDVVRSVTVSTKAGCMGQMAHLWLPEAP